MAQTARGNHFKPKGVGNATPSALKVLNGVARIREIPHGPEPETVAELMTLRDATRASGLSRWTLNRLVDQGDLHAVKVPARPRVYYLPWEIRALINQPCVVGLAA